MGTTHGRELITPPPYEAAVWVLAAGLALGALNAAAVLSGHVRNRVLGSPPAEEKQAQRRP
jgi:hypothetical protein